MRVDRRVSDPSVSESESEASSGASNTSTQAQWGGRSGYADGRFDTLNRSPQARQAVERHGYERTRNGLDNLMADNEGTKLADKALVARFAMTHLYDANLKPKLGGSLAGRLRGARRDPGDVDIEMPSARELDAARERLTGRFRYAGEMLRIRPDEDEDQPGVGAVLDVKLERSEVRASSARVGIDLVNENTPVFNQNIVAPERTGSPAVGTTETFRLVLNAIDRRINKPEVSERKRDAESVYHLLKVRGYRPSDPAHWKAIKEQIGAKLQNTEDVAEYTQTLRQMLKEHSDERRARHSSRKARSKSGCIVM